MISFFILCISVVTVFTQSNVANGIENVRRNSNRETNFWRMPANHPLRMELEQNPGILLGRVEDFDLSKLRKGDFSSLKKGSMNSKTRNPIDAFFRKQRSSNHSQCNIEIRTIISHPGHCVTLGDSTPACQNDEFIDINYNECN